ncbi:MAG: response regulator [Elusimicrobiota bacterium]
MAHILVVEDERDVVTLIKFLLEKDGHRVSEAYNGAEALQFLGVEPDTPKTKEQLPDLVIIDVMMPVMDGFTATRKMNEHGKAKSIPVVVLTAKGQVRDLFENAPNVAAYLEKPFDPKKLKEMISSLLGTGPA